MEAKGISLTSYSLSKSKQQRAQCVRMDAELCKPLPLQPNEKKRSAWSPSVTRVECLQVGLTGCCTTAETYVSFPSHTQDGSEEVDPCGDGLSPLDHSRSVLGIRLCSRLLLGPKPNTLLLVAFN